MQLCQVYTAVIPVLSGADRSNFVVPSCLIWLMFEELSRLPKAFENISHRDSLLGVF